MPPERVAALEARAKASPYFDRKDSPELQLRHDMMRAKLSGFLDRPDTVYRRYPLGDHSLPARYARAISTYRYGNGREAIAQIDGLIQSQPNNPYFYELKGQALLEGGHPAEAIAPLRRAVALAHDAPLIDIMLGQALIATDNVKSAEEAVPLLRTALAREPEAPDAYAQLAMAYGRKGDLANADLAAAQAAFTRGDIMTARQLASRAKTRLPVGSPAWVRADDIVSVKPPAAAKQMTTARIKPMTSSPRLIAAVCAALLAVAAPQAARAQNFSPAQRVRDRTHRARLSDRPSGSDCRRRWPNWRSGRPRPKPRSTRSRSRSMRRRCSPRPARSRSAIRTATSPSSSSSTTIAATASAPWTTCSRS